MTPADSRAVNALLGIVEPDRSWPNLTHAVLPTIIMPAAKGLLDVAMKTRKEGVISHIEPNTPTIFPRVPSNPLVVLFNNRTEGYAPVSTDYDVFGARGSLKLQGLVLEVAKEDNVKLSLVLPPWVALDGSDHAELANSLVIITFGPDSVFEYTECLIASSSQRNDLLELALGLAPHQDSERVRIKPGSNLLGFPGTRGYVLQYASSALPHYLSHLADTLIEG